MFLYRLKLFSAIMAISMLMAGSAAATIADSKTVNLEMTVLAPPCSVSTTPVIDFGNVDLTTQTSSQNILNVEITCDLPVNTKVVASLVDTDLVDSTTAAMMSSVQGSGRSAAMLRLYETTNNINQYVKLTGNDADFFCNSSENRTCTLVPQLTTWATGTVNQVRASIKFDLIYV
ncbi:hypothetical protein ID360_004147 [Salmonella enterica]|nr:hypothetical protein [Salmonella enterica]ELJ2931540.1 hypothetical protein [Salmonella enterica subsp. enterica]EDJ4952296.1 hypothetical protein [Salmonella enterica]EGB2280610.1 hypothetical protein [Salmonella enterica]EGH0940761.1 hypothetical protein [Salmonella enterica]